MELMLEKEFMLKMDLVKVYYNYYMKALKNLYKKIFVKLILKFLNYIIA